MDKTPKTYEVGHYLLEYLFYVFTAYFFLTFSMNLGKKIFQDLACCIRQD